VLRTYCCCLHFSWE